jgi:hypothetical protein
MGMKTNDGRSLDVEIRQGLNEADFMLVGRLLSNDSTTPFEATAQSRNTSVPITIRFIVFINGKPTCESWMWPKSRPSPMFPCPIHSWSG